MKTTEFYLEQVLIGFLIVAIGALPWIPEYWPKIEETKAVINLIGGSAAALGLAFWLGIPFDRLADTLSDRLDKRNRLIIALDEYTAMKNGRKELKADPYPEHQYMITCRHAKGAVIKILEYYRARIRLSRAIAVYGPAITAIATFAVPYWVKGTHIIPGYAVLWFGIVGLSYCIWISIFSYGEDLPSTRDEAKFAEFADGRKRTKDHVKVYEESEFVAWRSEWRGWIAPVLLLLIALVYGLIKVCERPEVLATACAGTILTAVSAWSWWRISTTYRKFLLDYCVFNDHRVASKSA